MSSRQTPKSRALQQNAGSQIATLLQPLAQSSHNNNKNTVNHALINRQNLKAAAIKNRLQKEEDEIKRNEELFKMSRFKNATSLIHQKAAEKVSDHPHAFTRKGEGKGIVAKLNSLNINKNEYRGVPLRQGGSAQSYGGDEGACDDETSCDDYAAYPHQYEDGGRFEEEEEEENASQLAQQDQYNTQDNYSTRDDANDHEYDEENIHDLYGSQSNRPPSHPASQLSLKPRVPSRDELNERCRSSRSHQIQQAQQQPNYIAANAKRVIQESKEQASSRQHAGNNGVGVQKHDSFGKVPAYIQQRKAIEQEKAAIKAKEDEAKNQGIPPGMILMPEEQRVQTLAVLQENHRKVLADLSAFPLRIETHSRQRAKTELENKLKEIEDAVALFSRKKVFVAP